MLHMGIVADAVACFETLGACRDMKFRFLSDSFLPIVIFKSVLLAIAHRWRAISDGSSKCICYTVAIVILSRTSYTNLNNSGTNSKNFIGSLAVTPT